MREIACKNCGNHFSGNFCNQCGEKVYKEDNKSIAHFLEESFHFLTHLDSKFLRSFWLVFTKPGYVSHNIVNGVRKKYFKPVNMFFLGVILYLLFPFFQGLNIPLNSHLKELYAPYVKMLVKQKMNNQKLTLAEIAKKYDAKSPKFAKILLLIIIPLSGGALSILFYKKRQYYFDHLTLAAELNTFYLYFTFFIIPIVFYIVFILVRLFNSSAQLNIGDDIITPLYLVAYGTYCTAAFIRFYRETKIRALLKTILYLAMHMIIVFGIYRVILVSVVLLFT